MTWDLIIEEDILSKVAGEVRGFAAAGVVYRDFRMSQSILIFTTGDLLAPILPSSSTCKLMLVSADVVS